MSLMEGLEELRGSINTETAKHLIDAERDRSKFNDSGCVCPLCASRIHLLALLDRAVKSEARIAELEDAGRAMVKDNDRLFAEGKALEARIAELEAGVGRVREIHKRDECGFCAECSWEYPEASYDAIDNDVPWPCQTVVALGQPVESEGE